MDTRIAVDPRQDMIAAIQQIDAELAEIEVVRHDLLAQRELYAEQLRRWAAWQAQRAAERQRGAA